MHGNEIIIPEHTHMFIILKSNLILVYSATLLAIENLFVNKPINKQASDSEDEIKHKPSYIKQSWSGIKHKP